MLNINDILVDDMNSPISFSGSSSTDDGDDYGGNVDTSSFAIQRRNARIFTSERNRAISRQRLGVTTGVLLTAAVPGVGWAATTARIAGATILYNTSR